MSDIKNSTITAGIPQDFEPDTLAWNNYYAFGMLQLGRNSSSSSYRYGFNGMEKDDEVKGSGNEYVTEFRQYDPRLVRWTSLDQLSFIAPGETPYSFGFNNSIYFTDPLGLFPGGGNNTDRRRDRKGGSSRNKGKFDARGNKRPKPLKMAKNKTEKVNLGTVKVTHREDRPSTAVNGQDLPNGQFSYEKPSYVSEVAIDLISGNILGSSTTKDFIDNTSRTTKINEPLGLKPKGFKFEFDEDNNTGKLNVLSSSYTFRLATDLRNWNEPKSSGNTDPATGRFSIIQSTSTSVQLKLRSAQLSGIIQFEVHKAVRTGKYRGIGERYRIIGSDGTNSQWYRGDYKEHTF